MQHVWDVLMVTATNQRFPNEIDCVPFLKGPECQKDFLHIDNRCVDHVISGAKVHLNNYSPMPSLPSLPPSPNYHKRTDCVTKVNCAP